jgi:hypothetical protein
MAGGPSDEVPAAMAAHVEDLTGFPPTAFVVTRHTKTRYGGLWAMFGELRTCIVETPDGGLACGFTQSVMTHGLSLGVAEKGIIGGRIYTMHGIAPNWARWARLDVGGGTHTIQIENNVYELRAPKRIVLQGFANRE